MPHLQFDNRISWMDIVAITAAALTALSVYFGVSNDVQVNGQKIAHIQTNIQRIEASSEKHEGKILKILEAQKIEMKEYRQESRQGQRQVVDKLDRLIERELLDTKNTKGG